MLLHDALKEDHDELRRIARRVLAEKEPWPQMVALGWTEVAELTTGERAALFEECGRVLAPVPFLSTTVASLALGRPVASGSLACVGAVAVRDGRLHGEKRWVVDGDSAEWLVVEAEGALYLTAGGERRHIPTLDETRRLATVRFDGTPAERLPGDGLARTLDLARVLLGAEQLGGAERCLDMAVDYAKTRVQFGRAIGSFQAVKHTLADMMVAVEAARSACRYAAWVADAAPAELPLAAAIARATATQTYLHCAGANIQVHGGVGFTWEHAAHRYFKRARASATLFAGDERAAVLRHLEL
jgi:alkylation response protein AidB-like acyl-CoA dehydrogenase